MKKCFSIWSQILSVFVLSLTLAIPQWTFAQDHVVSSSDLQRDVAGASAARESNLTRVQESLSSPEVREAMKSAHVDYEQVKNGVSQLSDEDLSRLAARSDKAHKDFAAGSLSNRDLIIILVAIAVLILIIVAVR